MPRLCALSSQSFIAQGTPFDSGFVTNGDFNDPIGTFGNPWTTSNFVGGAARPTRNANNQVEFVNNCILTQTVSGLPTNTTFTLSFVVNERTAASTSHIYVNWVTAGIPGSEIRTFIQSTGLITATVNNLFSSSATIEFRVVNDAGNTMTLDKVKLVVQ